VWESKGAVMSQTHEPGSRVLRLLRDNNKRLSNS